jgi:hypothetical protein
VTRPPREPYDRGDGVTVIEDPHVAEFGTDRPGLNRRGAELAAAMTEADLDRQVRLILADLPAVLGYHTHMSARSHRGFPDWVFAGPRGVLWRELKREKEKPTPTQQRWLTALSEAGQDAAVWRPSDLLCGDVARQLATLAAMGAALTGIHWPQTRTTP